MARDTSLTWTEIDPNTLPEDARKAYEEYKAIYRQAKEAKGRFEATMQTMASEGNRFVFGYNFGKLSIAVTEAKEEKAKPQAKQGLSQFLASQAASGHRC